MLRRLIIYHHIHKNIHFVHKIYNVFEVINFFSNSFFLIHKSLSRTRCWIEVCLCFENLLTPYALFFISDFSLLSESETTINIRPHAVPASCYSFKVNTGKMCEISSKVTTQTPQRQYRRRSAVFMKNLFEMVKYLYNVIKETKL